MYIHRYKERVRYADTDKMGFLYYGHYAKYYEIGRVEALRDLGTSYQKMEDEQGIMLPVLSLESRYLKPALYDQEITITTILKDLPTKFLTFEHELYNPDEELINKATVKLFWIEMASGKRVNTPPSVLNKLMPYFA